MGTEYLVRACWERRLRLYLGQVPDIYQNRLNKIDKKLGALVGLCIGAFINNAESPDAIVWAAVTKTPVVTAAELPGGSRVDEPLRRGPNGDIEIVDPTARNGSGPRRCTKGTICVGKDQGYQGLSQAVAAAAPGMTIEVDRGTYHESITIPVPRLTIRGTGGTPHIDCTRLQLAGDKACILLAADGITLENLDIGGAVLPEGDGANGACVRNEPNLSLTLRRVVCHGSQDGLLTSGGKIIIENSEFYDNGWTGLTHNAYLGEKCTAIVRGSIFRDARVGHEFKSRCQHVEIADSTFRSTHGSRNLDIPDGGEVVVYRSLLVKTSGSESEQIIGFAAESCRNAGNMVLKNVKVVNTKANAAIQNFGKCSEAAIALEGVSIEGLPVHEFGYILRR